MVLFYMSRCDIYKKNPANLVCFYHTMNDNKMPLGMKLIVVFYVFSLFTGLVSLAKNLSRFSHNWTDLYLLSGILGIIVPIFAISAIYLKKWITPFLALLGFSLIMYVVGFFRIMTSSATELMALSGTKLPDNLAALPPDKIEQAFTVGKMFTAGIMFVGILLGLFIFLYLYKKRDYFDVKNIPVVNQ